MPKLFKIIRLKQTNSWQEYTVENWMEIHRGQGQKVTVRQGEQEWIGQLLILKLSLRNKYFTQHQQKFWAFSEVYEPMNLQKNIRMLHAE